MTNPASRARYLVVLAAFGLTLSACVVTPTPYGLYVGPAVPAAPPPAQVEYYGPAPYAGAFWVGGYWNWVGGRYTWVNGYWERPRPGYRWEARSWVRGRDGWHMHGGTWVRR
jgi:hypothetical protein